MVGLFGFTERVNECSAVKIPATRPFYVEFRQIKHTDRKRKTLRIDK